MVENPPQVEAVRGLGVAGEEGGPGEVVVEEGVARGAGGLRHDADVVGVAGAREGPDDDVAGAPVPLQWQAAGVAAEEDGEVAHPPVVDGGIGPGDAVGLRRAQDVLVHQALEVDPRVAEGTDDHVGADADLPAGVAPGVGDGNVPSVVAGGLRHAPVRALEDGPGRILPLGGDGGGQQEEAGENHGGPRGPQ